MKNITKILGAVTMAGIVAIGGSAFTAGGVTNPANTMSGFIGGTVDQGSTGAVLENVAYATADGGGGKDDVTGITLTFTTSVEGRLVTATLSNGTPGDEEIETCTTGAAETATCGPFTAYEDLESLAVRVSNPA